MSHREKELEKNRMNMIKKLSDGVLALLITILIYAVFFAIVSQSPGDEMNNSLIAMATFIAMTFFINFPVCWWIIKRIIKASRGKNH